MSGIRGGTVIHPPPTHTRMRVYTYALTCPLTPTCMHARMQITIALMESQPSTRHRPLLHLPTVWLTFDRKARNP